MDPNDLIAGTPAVDAELLAAVDAALETPAPAAVDTPPAPAPPADTPPAPVAADVPPVDKPVDDPAAKPADAPPAAVDTPPAPPAAKPSDEFGELPADAPAKTRERFEAMKTKFDEVATERNTLVAERDALKADRDTAAGIAKQWNDTVASTGATGDQFGAMLGYLSAVNSGTPEGLEQAYASLQEELAVIAKALGRDAGPAYDPLNDPVNADLKARVDVDLDRKDALELAQARATRNLAAAAAQTKQAQATRTTQEQAAAQQEQDDALADIRAFGAEVKASDPHYAAKMKAIKPAVDEILQTKKPREWAAAVSRAYALAKVDVAPAPASRTVANVPDPIRPTGSPSASGALDKQPASALEAMEMALGK